MAAFKRAIALNPSYARAHYNLGTLFLQRKDYQAALEPLQEALRLNPQSSNASYNLAAAYAHLGERANALAWLQKAVELDPALASEAREEEDFQTLRSDPAFQALTQPR
jgi:tetratricopeptide (TPR) repeat protein